MARIVIGFLMIPVGIVATLLVNQSFVGLSAWYEDSIMQYLPFLLGGLCIAAGALLITSGRRALKRTKQQQENAEHARLLATMQEGETPEQVLARARKLIEAREYASARALLLKLEHPTAKQWLARLEQLRTN
jgi:hypothetical protein